MSSNRGKKTLTQNPKFPLPTPFSSSSSKQLQKKHQRNPNKKQPRQIWVKKETRRNWLELPRDVMLDIFLKLGVIEILFTAQSVCSSWRDIARDPVLYRRLDLSDPWDRFNECDFEPVVELVLQAIDRSCGQLEDFSIRYFGTDEMLQRIVDTSCRLKKLTLAICDEVSDDALLEVVANMPCWEEVEICQCSFSLMAIEAVGRACKSTLPSTDCRQSRISIFNSVLTSPNDSRVMSLMPFEDDYNKDYESVFRMWLSYKFDATSCF